MTSQPKRVFISYAREDIDYAKRLYAALKNVGVDPWLDEENLLPGQQWKAEISKAIRDCDFFLALLSSKSVNKKGHVQKELREALDIFEEFPASALYLIPARLDDCRPSDPKLAEINWVDLFPVFETGLRKILLVIRPGAVVSSGHLSSAIVENPNDLSQTGWGVIFHRDTPEDVIVALHPLLRHRRQEASLRHKHFYREFSGASGYQNGDSKLDFLARHGAGPGPADPHRVPYYLLIVGDPEQIPFEFQYQLGIQYRVGRIHFNSAEEYTNYSRNVVEAETNRRLPKEAIFFGVENIDDPSTTYFTLRLAQPLAEAMSSRHPDWKVRAILANEATRECLLSLFKVPIPPALLFIVAHGLAYRSGDYRQAENQGAIVCREWPGLGQAVQEEHCFGSVNIPPEADLRGMTLFLFACFSAGTSRVADVGLGPTEYATYSFVAPLVKRLLGKEGGALACIGHVGSTWKHSIQWPSAGPQIQTFEAGVNRLLDGHRVGLALEYFTQRYAEISAEIGANSGQGMAEADLATLKIGEADAKGYILIGDPAARTNLTHSD